MDWSELVRELGGGFQAVVTVGVAWLAWNERKRANDAMDARLNDVREHGRELREVSDNATAALNALARLLEDRRGG